MPYATEQDLIDAAGGVDRWRELSGPDGTTERAERLKYAQDAGDALVIAYLGPEYAQPVDLPSDVMLPLVHCAAREGIYALVTSRGVATEAEVMASEQRRQTLQEMARGKQWPATVQPKHSTTTRPGFVRHKGGITRDSLKGFVG